MNSKDFNNKIVSLAPRIYPVVVRFLGNKEDSEDALQEIMLRLWAKRSSLKDHPNPGGFAFLTARNYCLDKIKKKKIGFSDLSVHYDHKATDNSESKHEAEEAYKLIESILESLPENQRKVIILRDIDGLEFDEIAILTGIRKEHLRVLLSRARKSISSKMNEIYSYEYGKIRRTV